MCNFNPCSRQIKDLADLSVLEKVVVVAHNLSFFSSIFSRYTFLPNLSSFQSTSVVRNKWKKLRNFWNISWNGTPLTCASPFADFTWRSHAILVEAQLQVTNDVFCIDFDSFYLVKCLRFRTDFVRKINGKWVWVPSLQCLAHVAMSSPLQRLLDMAGHFYVRFCYIM